MSEIIKYSDRELDEFKVLIEEKIEKAKKDKPKFKSPVIVGKAYASDKAGKTMQVPPLTTAQRKQMKKEMAEAAERGYKKARFRKFGYKKGKFV